jgi:hypothetical protein
VVIRALTLLLVLAGLTGLCFAAINYWLSSGWRLALVFAVCSFWAAATLVRRRRRNIRLREKARWEIKPTA